MAHQHLVLGNADDALSVRCDGEFIRTCKDDLRRVFEVECWQCHAGGALGIWNEGPSFIPPNNDYPGQRFIANEDGTISLQRDPRLVLGAYVSVSESESEISV